MQEPVIWWGDQESQCKVACAVPGEIVQTISIWRESFRAERVGQTLGHGREPEGNGIRKMENLGKHGDIGKKFQGGEPAKLGREVCLGADVGWW